MLTNYFACFKQLPPLVVTYNFTLGPEEIKCNEKDYFDYGKSNCKSTILLFIISEYCLVLFCRSKSR